MPAGPTLAPINSDEEKMAFPENLGAITCRCVLENGAPVLFVSHAGNDWQMYCRTEHHDFDDPEAMKRELAVVHIKHLVAKDPTLDEVSDLPADMGAERVAVGASWTIFHDADHD